MNSTLSGYVDRAGEVLRIAENSLRMLLTEAAEHGDYEAVSRVAEPAKEVSKIITKLSVAKPSDGGGSVVRSKGAEVYPKFFRSADNKLIMFGWSKKGQTEYEHKAPRAILDQLISKLLKSSTDGEPTPIDELLPALKSDDGSIAPEYYGRTCLRWLRAVGLLKKVGHQGYSIINRANFNEDVNSYWRRLAVR